MEPGVDAVLIDGVAVSRDSLVRLHPSRRADAQDLFFAEQSARVSGRALRCRRQHPRRCHLAR
ncbi:MAG: hypothetical protein WKF73_15320 [Nocardioidaceae bacterium]